MNSEDNRKAKCGTHGEVELAMVCCHLFKQLDDANPIPIKYFESEPEPDEIDQTDKRCVWCVDCDLVLEREGEWNDESEGFSDPHLICEFCLQKVLDFNIPGNNF